MGEADIIEIKVALARVEEKLASLSDTLAGFCNRQQQLNITRQQQIDNLSAHIDKLESWRDSAEGSMRVLWGLGGFATIVAAGSATVIIKHLLGL